MSPVLSWRGLELSAYWTFYALGYALGLTWLRGSVRRAGWSEGDFRRLAGCGVLGSLLGAKLGYLLFEEPALLRDWGELLLSWSTGWVFWTGLLGGLLGLELSRRWSAGLGRPRGFLETADHVLTGAALGHALGRIGCLLEGCCHGTPTRLPWGISFHDPYCSVEDALLGVPLHPTQLYESLGQAAAALVLIRAVMPARREGRLPAGAPALGYLVYYSLLRFGIEFLRGDDRGSLLSPVLSPSQWVSLAVGAAALAGLGRLLKSRRPAA